MCAKPKLLEALALRLDSMGTTIRKAGITGIFSGGTEFTPQWNRFAHEELLDGAYMTPTYGNTLMGLAASAPSGPDNGYKIAYYAPQPRAVIQVVDLDNADRVVSYGETGRVRLTTLTREFFMPGFLERDALRAVPIDDLIARIQKAGDLYLTATLPMGDGTQTPDEFVRAQSATTGLPERLARANMKKNSVVLTGMRQILSALTRALDFT